MRLVTDARSRASSILRSPAIKRCLLLTRARRGLATGSKSHVLVCPPGAGNLGDQALVEAFLENVSGPITLVVRDSGDFSIPERERSRVTIATMPHLIYGRLPKATRDIGAFKRLLHRALSVSVVGADVMDGAYNFRASAVRSAIVEAASRRGVPSRVLGFSWNSAPHPVALKYLKRAARRGVDLYVRDPKSFARAAADGIPGIHEAADIVFSARTVDDSLAAAERLRFNDTTRPLALVNVSGLIRKTQTQDLTADYVSVVRHLALSHNVLLVPHVVKTDSDDLLACNEILGALQACGIEHIRLLREPLSPATVRGLCGSADIVVTGRMHLAVNGFLRGRMPITLATQGKVEGLMDLFDAGFLCVEPRAGMGEPILTAIRSAEVESRAAQLHAVIDLSAQNFRGLPTFQRQAV